MRQPKYDRVRSRSPCVSDLVQFLRTCPDRARCPESITRLLVGSQDGEIDDARRAMRGKSVEDLPPSLALWESHDVVVGLPWLARIYYMPSLLEQAMLLSRPQSDIHAVFQGFMPPPDNKKNQRMLLYAIKWIIVPSWYHECIMKSVDVVLQHAETFECGVGAAARLRDRFWGDPSPWFDRLRQLMVS